MLILGNHTGFRHLVKTFAQLFGKELALHNKLFSSPFHRKEFNSYVQFLLKEHKVTPFLQKLYRYSSTRLLKKSVPPQYQQLLNHICLLADFTANEIEKYYFNVKPIIEEENKSEINASLATRIIDLESHAQWNISFDDQEDIFSLHRFGWLLPIISSGRTITELRSLKELIVNWIESNPYKESGSGWDSYSVSERIVNWIFFLSALQALPIKEDYSHSQIIQSLWKHVQTLLNGLEFRRSATNNHLINNGRALYLSGAFLGCNQALETGREILKLTSRDMFTESGFLREGSSHYQILLARTFLEALWCAERIDDKGYKDDMFDFTKRVAGCARFFLSETPFPLFGDVSPDFPPDFHLGLPEVADLLLEDKECFSTHDETGWHTLLISGDNSKHNIDDSINNHSCNYEEVAAYPDAGYYCIANSSYSIFIYVNPLGYVPEWSHGHSDIGGFVMYWNHQPFLVDCGRLNFHDSSMGKYGRSVRSHNSISIDGYEPCVTHGLNGFAQLMVREYVEPPPVVKLEERNDSVKIQIEYYGFKRIWKDLKVSRTFYCEKNSLIIEDDISGKDTHKIETFFHLHPEVNPVSNGKDEVRFSFKGGEQLKLISRSSQSVYFETFKGTEVPFIAGWYFPRYGQSITTNTIICSQKAFLPLRNRYVFERV